MKTAISTVIPSTSKKASNRFNFLDFEDIELAIILKALKRQSENQLFKKLKSNLEQNNIYLSLNEPPMSYKDFTLTMVLEKFKLNSADADIFGHVEAIPKEELAFFYQTLERNLRTPMISEKARSEAIIFPVLTEILDRNVDEFVIFSGKTFDVDGSLGLTGRCDFLLSSAGATKNVIHAPVFIAVEAKKGVVEDHLGQCAAEMMAARIFNQQKKKEIETIFGVVTSGMEWLFMKLEGDTIYVDKVHYYEKETDMIIAIFQEILNTCKK
ncbi:MAG: hypothetical protein R3E32_14510 [Chitinophagales bacterium]